MAVKTKRQSDDEVARDLEASQVEDIRLAEPIDTRAHVPSPISARLSPPLLEKLDAMASSEHRSRGNLIQHILWDYIRQREADAATSKKRAMRARH